MLYAFLVISVMANVALIALLRRSATLNLQFDEIFEQIAPVMEDYAAEMRRTLTGGLLEDHPEVAAFHRLNLRHLQNLEAVVENVKSTRPKKKLPKVDPDSVPLVE